MGKIKDALTTPMVKTQSGRSGLMAVAGGYVVYMAYDMFRDLLSGETADAGVAAYLAAGVLCLGGVGILVYAVRNFFVAYKAEQAALAQEETGEE